MNISLWFKGIKGKLLLAAFLPVFGFAVLGFVSFRGIDNLSKLIEKADELIIPNLEYLNEQRQARNKFGYRIYSAISKYDDKQDPSAELAIAKEAIEEYERGYKNYSETAFLPEEEVMYAKVKDEFPKIISLMHKIHDLLLKPENQPTVEKMMAVDFVNESKEVGAYSQEVLKMYLDLAKKEQLTAKESEKTVMTWMWITIIVSTLVVFMSLMYIAHQISKSVSHIADRLTGAASNVATSVVQLNSAGNDLSQSSTQAAASLEETVASLEELSSMVRMNSDNAKQAASLSVSSREAAEKGQQEIETLITSMQKISNSSKKIEEIIHVIDDIAFQTNLLALNAAVEAARAGEQGKGFAVVAEAVRALAQRSAAAAKDIAHLIKDSVSQVQDGSRIASQSGMVLNNIVNSVKKVADLNTEISAASSEQTAGIQQISKAMNQLDQSAQTNAASAEEIAATSGEISDLATTTQGLTVELGQFIHGVDGATVTSGKPRAEVAVAKEASSSRDLGEKDHAKTVIPFKAPVKSAAPKKSELKAAPATDKSQNVIPFDDDDDRAKVGTTDGF